MHAITKLISLHHGSRPANRPPRLGPAPDRRRARGAALWAAALLLSIAMPLRSHAQAVTFQGIVTTVAGNGSEENESSVVDNILATSADVGLPEDVKVDANGNIYLVDWSAGRIRKVNAVTGIITTVAGGGSGCAGQTNSEGDGCLGTQASLNTPVGVALDAAGNVYIADNGAHVIRKVTAATGIITIVAGTFDNNGYTGDGGLATSATLNRPTGVVVDSAGNIYIADYLNNVVRVVNTQSTSKTILGVTIGAGDIQTVAGNGSGTCGTATDSVGDGCPDIDANSLSYPQNVALDASGNLYIAENEGYLVRKITASTGIITTVAGNGNRGFSGDGAAATSAEVSFLDGVALDNSGNIYITDGGNYRIRVINTQSTAITIGGVSIPAGDIQTVAGNGTDGYADDLPPLNAEFSRIGSAPGGLTVDGSGNIYIADYGNDRIREVQYSSVDFGFVNVGQLSPIYSIGFYFNSSTTIAGDTVLTQGVSGLDFQSAADATCTAGTYTSGESCTYTVQFIAYAPTLNTGVLDLTGSGSSLLDTIYLSGTGSAPYLNFTPSPQVTLSTLDSYVTKAYGLTFDAAGNLYVADVGPSGTVDKFTSVGVHSTVGSGFDRPYGVAVDGAGNVFVGDYTIGIVEVTPAGAQTTLGTGVTTVDAIAVDRFGNVYAVCCSNGNLVKITPSGTQTNLGGRTFSFVRGLAVDRGGNVYIAATNEAVVYKLTPSGSLTTLPLTGLHQPEGLAFDSAGDLFVSDASAATVVELTADGTQITVPTSGLVQPSPLAIDTVGDIYIGDINTPGAMYELERSQTPSLTFATTEVGATSSDSPQTVTVFNGGNATLNFTVPSSGDNPSYPTNFPENSSDSNLCTSATPLLVAGSCDVSVDFTPTVSGYLTANVVLMDNNLNESRITQSINVSGTGELTAQTITFTNPGTQTIGTPVPALVATATSGLTVTFTSATTSVCTVSGTAVTLVSAGTCTIDANQAGNSTYAAAPQVAQSFTVNPASLTSQTITFSNPGTQSIGTPVPALAATASSGLTVTFTSATASVCTVSGTAVTLVSKGTCTIDANQAGNSTYAAAPQVAQSFSVNGEPQTITFPNPGTQAIGAAVPALTATATSGLAVTFNSATTSICAVSGATVTLVSAGTCTIDANQAGNSTYAAAPQVAQSFSVNGEAQTITFTNPGAQTIGTAVPALTATATSGLTVSFTSATTSVCTVSGTAVTLVSTGTCTIDANQAGNSTYAAAPQIAQSFTVNPAPLTAQTITFTNPGAQTIGTAVPALAATSTSGLTVSFTSATTSVCTVSGTAVTLVSAGTCTIDANQAGNSTYAAAPQVSESFTVNPAPNFAVASSTPSQTVQPGAAATYTINVSPVNGAFTSAVTLAASGLPTGATASFSPSTVTPGDGVANSTLTIQTSALAGTKNAAASPWPLAAPALAAIGLFFVPGKRRRRWLALGVLLFVSLGALTALSGCGGGFALPGSPAQSYTITVAGTSGSDQQTTTVQLTVQ